MSDYIPGCDIVTKFSRSITGYNSQLSSTGPLMSWKSRKQQTVVLSTCEAEYVALADAVQVSSIISSD